MCDFDSIDFDAFDVQSPDVTSDHIMGTDFTTTDSTYDGNDMGGSDVELPHPDPYPTITTASDSDDFGKLEVSFGARNHDSNTETVQQLGFRPDHNGHNDDYHSALSHNHSEPNNDGGHNNEVSFKGTPQEKAEWAKKAQSEKEWVNFYNKQADSCLIHNDINGYQKNLELAKKHAEYYDKFIANSKK